MCYAKRYLKFIPEVETSEVGREKLHQLAETKVENDRRYKGFNLLLEEDASLPRLLLRGKFAISGFANKTLRQYLPHKNSGQITRLLKRLRVHGIIKKVGRRYKYYLRGEASFSTTRSVRRPITSSTSAPTTADA